MLKVLLTFIPPLLGVRFTAAWANAARVVGVRQSSVERAKKESSSPFSSIGAGDMVISNFTNILEVGIVVHVTQATV